MNFSKPLLILSVLISLISCKTDESQDELRSVTYLEEFPSASLPSNLTQSENTLAMSLTNAYSRSTEILMQLIDSEFVVPIEAKRRQALTGNLDLADSSLLNVRTYFTTLTSDCDRANQVSENSDYFFFETFENCSGSNQWTSRVSAYRSKTNGFGWVLSNLNKGTEEIHWNNQGDYWFLQFSCNECSLHALTVHKSTGAGEYSEFSPSNNVVGYASWNYQGRGRWTRLDDEGNTLAGGFW